MIDNVSFFTENKKVIKHKQQQLISCMTLLFIKMKIPPQYKSCHIICVHYGSSHSMFWTSTKKVDFSWQIGDGRNIQMVYHLLLENRKFLCHSIRRQWRNDLTRTPTAYFFSTNEKTIVWTLWTLGSFSACVEVNDNWNVHVAVSPLKI